MGALLQLYLYFVEHVDCLSFLYFKFRIRVMYSIYLEILVCALSTRVSVLILTCGLQFQVLTAMVDFCVSGWRGWCTGIDESERLMYFG